VACAVARGTASWGSYSAKAKAQQSVGEGKEIYSPHVENAKCRTRLGDRESHAAQSVSEFDSCVEEITHLKEPKEVAVGC
jgi:hypothetical protein